MSINFKSFTEIFQEMAAELESQGSGLTDLNEGSQLYVLLRAYSAAVSNGWTGLADLKSLFFVNSSHGTDLEARVADFDMTKKPGAFAAGVLAAYPLSTGQSVTVGDYLTNSDGTLLYEVLESKTIESPYTTVGVVATDVGFKYNLPAGAQLFGVDGLLGDIRFVVATDGIDINGKPSGALSGGVDAETDEELKSRFSAYLKSLARGTRTAIDQAIRGINGVGNVIIEEAKPAPGWITVTIADSLGILTPQLKEETESVLKEWGPAGMGYIIKSILKTPFTIEVNVYCKDLTVARSLIENTVTAQLTAKFGSLGIGEGFNSSQIINASFIPDILHKVEVVTPTTEPTVAPGELLGLDSVKVNVIYA
jgi:uncharacterized phage protein gp47/JayE